MKCLVFTVNATIIDLGNFTDINWKYCRNKNENFLFKYSMFMLVAEMHLALCILFRRTVEGLVYLYRSLSGYLSSCISKLAWCPRQDLCTVPVHFASSVHECEVINCQASSCQIKYNHDRTFASAGISIGT